MIQLGSFLFGIDLQRQLKLTVDTLGGRVYRKMRKPDGEEEPQGGYTRTSIPGIKFIQKRNAVYYRVPTKQQSPKKRKHLSEKLDDTNEDSEERMERAARKLKKRVDQLLEQSDSSDGSSQQ